MSSLATPRDVLALMESSRSTAEWNANCAAVARAHARERSPDRRHWSERILTGPLYARTSARFGDR